MNSLLHDLLLRSAADAPEDIALAYKDEAISYSELTATVRQIAIGLVAIGLKPQERVAIYLPKRPEAVAAIFGVSLAGGAFVPVNPILKAEQVMHILRDCNVRVLITGQDRVGELSRILADCTDLQTLVVVGADAESAPAAQTTEVAWDDLLAMQAVDLPSPPVDTDMGAIFYTSGSTGNPKGVVLSHRNMVAGAESVAQYLDNQKTDRVLAVLPFSFDYGFSQLTTAFLSGARVVLIDYLFPRDVINAVVKYGISGLAAVPPLWIQLAKLKWPDDAVSSLRYITNSGGAMPTSTLGVLRQILPQTEVYLMYGLTEAFRSTYLPPDEIDKRPDSMGKAIPNSEVMVVRDDGTLCEPGEPGELVHRGALVSLGYWNDPERTAKRFRPNPLQDPGIVNPELVVWSGDTVVKDDEGFLFFVGRRDDMIKTSGYRVSPTEIEAVIYASGIVKEAVAIGVSHPLIGQGIIVVAVPLENSTSDANTEKLLEECRKNLANFMIPGHVDWRTELPRNPNGKLDRKKIQIEFQGFFQEQAS
jgi:acyl-CoA ligase (AMP-forming) (exosortase A-associated)